MTVIYDKANKQLPQDFSALGNLKVSIEENNTGAVDQDVNLVEVNGASQTARDWSTDFATLPSIESEAVSIDAHAAAIETAAEAIQASNDVNRSTRASEFTVSAILAEAQSIDNKIDVNLSILAKLERWGRQVDPAWVHGGESNNPADGTTLATKAVSAGKTGYIYGFYITSPEASDFKINWTSGGGAKSQRIVHASKGTTIFTDKVPINEGTGADASSNMIITKIGNGTGVYQAGLLTTEV